MILNLDENLEVVPRKHGSKRALGRASETLDLFSQRHREKPKGKKPNLIKHNLTGEVFHRNWVDYLTYAWATHQGIVVTPDIIWYTILCELTEMVSKDPAAFRDLFTTREDKALVVVVSGSMDTMPMDSLIEELKKYVPTDTSTFFPEFTTSGERERFARYAALADMVSPYYYYSTTLCGFPAIDVQGSRDDWELLRSSWDKLQSIFFPRMENQYEVAAVPYSKHSGSWSGRDINILDTYDQTKTQLYWIKRVASLIHRIADSWQDPTFWGQMYKLDCGRGSGHTETEVDGWIVQLFSTVRESSDPSRFPAHAASVKYKQLETGEKFEMRQGLFSSRQEGKFLRPEFGHLIYKVA